MQNGYIGKSTFEGKIFTNEILLHSTKFWHLGSVSRRLSNTFRKAIITSHHDNVETSGLVYHIELFVVDMET